MLNSAQLNYTIDEKELLGIIERFKVFVGICRDQELTVHTDHLNLRTVPKHTASTHGEVEANAQRVASDNQTRYRR